MSWCVCAATGVRAFQYRSVLVVVQLLFHGPVPEAGVGLVGRVVAPAVGAALTVGRLHELLEGRGELQAAFAGPRLGEAVALVDPLDVPLTEKAVEVLHPDVGVDAQEALEERGVDLVAEALALEPEHHLKDLAAPVERPEGLRL